MLSLQFCNSLNDSLLSSHPVTDGAKLLEVEIMNIAVAGTGYVGLSIATLLAQHNHVVAVDVIPEKVALINQRKSPIQDEYIEKFFAEKNLDLKATLDGAIAYRDTEFVVIATPTNYDPQKNFFDTSHVEEVIDLVLSVNPDAVMVIKSTIPVGYCRSLYLKYATRGVKKLNLLFSPEFLRESKALYDNLYPSRIIVGYPKPIKGYDEENKAIVSLARPDLEDKAREFAGLLKQGAIPAMQASDIVEYYAGVQDEAASDRKKETGPKLNLSALERSLLEALDIHLQPVAEILDRPQLAGIGASAREMLCALTELSLKGLVEQEGNCFARRL